jgi:hypothetical protein
MAHSFNAATKFEFELDSLSNDNDDGSLTNPDFDDCSLDAGGGDEGVDEVDTEVVVFD